MAICVVADMLGMAYIRVYEIATFYTMFQLSLPSVQSPTSKRCARRRRACCAAPMS